MKERLKELRKALGLGQVEFSKRINIAQSTYSQFENGQRELREIHISQICTTFNVNEDWLRTGNGEMFNLPKKSLVDELVREYDLGESGRDMLSTFVSLPKKQRDLFMEFFNTFITPGDGKDDDAESTEILDHIDDNNEKETRA